MSQLNLIQNLAKLFALFSLLNIFYYQNGADCLSRYQTRKHYKAIDVGDRVLPDAQWYDQRLDHFDESLKTTWKQRYWVNDTFFTSNDGPVFVMIGGEGEENPLWMVEGSWIRYAQQFNALCVLLEHRFYGKSRPTDDLSTSNLQYLSSEQALADLASFTQYILSGSKYKLTGDNKVISFGGSYSGALSAWYRLKYPHLVHAAVASSAPIYAVVDFPEYLQVVNQSLEYFTPTCSQQVSLATAQVQDLMTSSGGRETLQKIFQTCDPIVSDDDATNFYASIANNFEGVVQYNLDNRAFEGAVDTNVTVEVVCNIMTNTQIGDPLSRYVVVNSLILQTYSQKCLDASYNKSIEELTPTSWNSSASVGGRQWFWQTCIEFGFYQSTDSHLQPFGPTFPIDFFTKQCAQVFGPDYDVDSIYAAVNDTNINYGGYNYQGTRVVFVNGNIDPWHALSFYDHKPNPFTEITFIKGTAHCADMYPSSHFDPIELEEARTHIITLLEIWLNE